MSTRSGGVSHRARPPSRSHLAEAGSNSPPLPRSGGGGRGEGAPSGASSIRSHSLNPSATGFVRLLSSRGTVAGLPRPPSTDPAADSSALQPPVRPHKAARPGLRMTDSPVHPSHPHTLTP